MRQAGRRRRPAGTTALAAAVLGAALFSGACGGADPAVTGASPAVSAGSACAAGDERDKPVPADARALVAAFVAAVDDGDLAVARHALDPAAAAEVLAGLGAVERLTLISFSDDY